MNSTEINANIAEALDILIEKRLSQLKFDQTIIAEIDSLVDPVNGLYKISYQSIILDAYNLNTNIYYKEKQSVYVKVPQNDFSQKLIIEGSVTNYLLEQQKQGIKNKKVLLEPVFEYNDNFSLTIESNNTNSTEQKQEYYFSSEDVNTKNFSYIASQYNTLYIEALFKNNFKELHTRGNYGLKFNFLNIDDTVTSFVLDTSFFNGDCYKTNLEGGIQGAYFNFKMGTLKGLKEIVLFQEGIQPENNNSIEISATDIKMQFCDIIDVSSSFPRIILNAEKGYVGEELPFSAALYNNGVIDVEQTSFYWYERIDENNWKVIPKTGNNIVLSFGQPEETIKYYKIVLYDSNGEIQAYKDFNIFQPFFIKLPDIIHQKEEDKIILSIPKAYTVNWELDEIPQETQDNTLILYLHDFKNQSIKVDANLYQNNIYLGTQSTYVIAPIKTPKVQVEFLGRTNYFYSANGNILSDYGFAEKELTIGLITPDEDQEIKFEFTLNNTLISDDVNNKLNLNNSYLQDVYYKKLENGMYTLYYTITDNFIQDKIHDLVQVICIYDNGEREKFDCDFYFSKIGDLGTNGYKNACYLYTNSYDNGADCLVNFKVFAQGNLITDTTQYNITNLRLQPNNIDYKNQIMITNQILVKKEDIDPQQIQYLELTLEVDNSKINTYYAIPVLSQGAENSNIYQTAIKYNFDGQNPDIGLNFDFKKAQNKNYYFTRENGISIIHYLNLDGNNSLSTWDGKAKIDSTNNSILTKELILGNKSSKSFSGILMGTVQDDTSKPTGIYGYSNNQKTFEITKEGIIVIQNFDKVMDFNGTKLSTILEEINKLIQANTKELEKQKNKIKDLENAVKVLEEKDKALEERIRILEQQNTKTIED